MGRYVRNPCEVEAVQWWPPGDARHSIEMGVRHPATEPLTDVGCHHDDCVEHPRAIQPGEIGELGGRYWIRTNSSTAMFLQPGHWIVRSPKYPFIEVLPDTLFWQLYSGPI